MRLRLVGLFLLALAAAGAAGAIDRADAGKRPLRPFHAEPTAPLAAPAPCPLPARLRPAFVDASRRTAIPTSLIVAIAQVESDMRPDATSTAGARGLLQLLPSTAAALALDANDPRQNVLGGARYLRSLVDRFGSIDLALAAYNAGPTAVARAGGVPSVASAGYVASINAAWRSLAGCE